MAADSEGYVLDVEESEDSEQSVQDEHQQTSKSKAPSKPEQKEELRELIQSNSSRIKLKNNSLKSAVWSSFKLVVLDEKPTNYAKCNRCPEIYKWSAAGGTNSLRRHDCSKGKVQPSTSSQPITSLFPRTVPETAKQALNRTIVLGLALDLRPLGSANSTGFVKIAQSLINFGSRHGQVDVKNVILNRTTLKRSVLPKVVADVKAEVIQNINKAAVQSKMAFTMDLWSDKHRSRSFLSLSAHFFDSEFKLYNQTLGVEEFPHEFKGTDNVRSECKRILRAFLPEECASQMLETAVSVTDSGSNVTKVFKTRMPCQCHKINNFLSNLFSQSNMSSKFPELNDTFKAIKDLVRYVKKSGINKDLPRSLKQAVPTRWCSELPMVDSYIESADEVRKKLEEKNEAHRLDKIDFIVAQQFSELLQPFEQCIKDLQAEGVPTIQLVALWFSRLRTKMQISEKDSALIQSIKFEAEPLLERYLKADPFYVAASLLNPWCRKMKFVTNEQADAAKTLLQELVDKENIQVKSSEELSEPPAKKRNQASSKFGSLLDSDEEDDDSVAEKNEVQAYLSAPNTSDIDKEDPHAVTKYWKMQTKFPKLRQVASWVLAIPASSASDERVFSATGYTLTPRRTSLDGSTLADMTFIHFNAK